MEETRSEFEKIKRSKKPSFKDSDFSPEGFNWVHYDFAVFVSQSVYEHNLDGIYKPKEMKRNRQALIDYLASLQKISRDQFKKWGRDHQVSFLINSYHAFLYFLMIEKDFQSLNDELLAKNKFIKIFGKNYNRNEFIKNELQPYRKSSKIYLSLNCFAEYCPELRNGIYNFKNLDNMLEISTQRFLMDQRKVSFDLDKNIIKLSPLFKKNRDLFPKNNKDFQSWLAPYYEKKDPKIANALKNRQLKIVY